MSQKPIALVLASDEADLIIFDSFNGVRYSRMIVCSFSRPMSLGRLLKMNVMHLILICGGTTSKLYPMSSVNRL